MKKIILLDMDSIIADLQGRIFELYNERYGGVDGEPLDYKHVTTWDYFEKGEVGSRIVKMFDEPGFFRSLKPIPGAIEAATQLNETHKIYIVSSVGRRHAPIAEKVEWLQEHFPFISHRKYVFTSAKELVRGDYLIDDAPHNVEAWKEMNPLGKALSIPYQYNYECPSYDFLGNWDSIAYYILLDPDLRRQRVG